MPSPPIRSFDVTPIINLALAQSATIEKRTLCDGCLDERRRLLEYALNGATTACGFEIVKLVAEFQAAKPSGSE